MKIYVSHSSHFDYVSELYEPLMQAFGDVHQLILPHETESEGVSAKDTIPSCDLVLAEVSYPSTGQGIELGWADASGVAMVCIYKSGIKPSSALRFLSGKTVNYDSAQLHDESFMVALIGG